tara:strand:- start:16 stop:588 length:573 start_codon:yes stop_codon:yes gene_type:complete
MSDNDHLLDQIKINPECVIYLHYGKEDGFYIYKRLNIQAIKIQGLMRRFFHWIDDEDGIKNNEYPVGLITANLIYFITRLKEKTSKHLYPDWMLNKGLKENLQIGSTPVFFGRKITLRYDIDLSTLNMTGYSRLHPDGEGQGTVYVGEIPDDDETSLGVAKAVTYLSTAAGGFSKGENKKAKSFKRGYDE